MRKRADALTMTVNGWRSAKGRIQCMAGLPVLFDRLIGKLDVPASDADC